MFPHISDAVFVGTYSASVVIFIVLVLLRGLFLAFNCIRKSIELHNKMFKRVIYAKMAFFDSTPIGRILNAFARHQYTIDAPLSDSLFQLLQYAPVIVAAEILCMIIMYPTVGVFGGAAILIGLLLFFLGRVESQLRNHDALSKSTIFSHLTATLEGLFSIRAYQCEERFISLFRAKIG